LGICGTLQTKKKESSSQIAEMERIVQQPVTIQPELFRLSNEVAVQVVVVLQEVQENISQQIHPPSTTSQNRRSMRTTNIPVRLGITSK